MKPAFIPAAFLILLFLPTVSSQCVMNDYTFYPVPNTPRPAKGVTFQDPVFHTNITRITDAPTEVHSNTYGDYAQPGYPKHNIENADGTRLIIQSLKQPLWHIWDANPPYNKIKDIPSTILDSIDPDVRWDNSDPNILYSGRGSKFYKYNIVTDEITMLHNFSIDFPSEPIARVYTAEEGDSSADSRYWAFVVRCYDANHSPTWWNTHQIVYDKDFFGRDNGKIISQLNEGDARGSITCCSTNFISMSPSGNYVVLGAPPSWIYPRDFSWIKVFNQFAGSHVAMGIDDNGKEVIVGVGTRYEGSTSMGYWTEMVDVETGARTWLTPEGGGQWHVATNNYDHPGWALYSIYTPNYPAVETKWGDHEIFMVELTTRTNPPPRLWRLAHTHTVRAGYSDDPFAKLNKNGTKVFFGSGWGQAFSWTGSQYDVYQIDLPEECYSYFPPAANCSIQGGSCISASCCSGLYCGSLLTCQTCLSSEAGKCIGGLDEDCDGLTDCNDPDCSTNPACVGCSNIGSSCASASCCSGLYCDSLQICQNCLSSETGHCTGGVNEDCDAQTDCSDTDCYPDPNCCKGLGESCVSGTCCSGLTCESAALGLPTATASANKLSGPAPLSVQFYGNGTDAGGSIASYRWSGGDSWSSTSQNPPAHTYVNPGNYKAVLTVTDNSGFKGSTYLDVHVTGGTNNVPAVAASAIPVSGTAPLTVTFTGSGTDSDGTISSYYWNFGDSWTSNSQNPSHAYANPGNYIATLTVWDNSSYGACAIVNITVTGSNAVCAAGGCLKAEISPCNGCVEMGELNTFIDRWKVSNVDVTLRDLIEAIGLWKKGC